MAARQPADAPSARMPFDGSQPLFKIGLHSLDLENWIEVDDRHAFYLSEKRRLNALHPQKVFVEEEGTREAQQEVLDLLVTHLPKYFPQMFQVDERGQTVTISPASGDQMTVDLKVDAPPLGIAASMVQEDLVLMRKCEPDGPHNGWRLAAASVCFPSSWSLVEKFSKPLSQIHEPVPGFGPGTRNAGMIDRIFDNLQVSLPVWRHNWSVYGDDALYHVGREAEHLQLKDGMVEAATTFLRVEYQTLRRLPVKGDILFTIRIHSNPLEALRAAPDRAAICEGFCGLLMQLDRDQLRYKRLDTSRDALIKTLEDIASNKQSNEGGSA